jgi:EAL domain-containing protein (putative c-di-GMP-specific phosphodiesterase class I)
LQSTLFELHKQGVKLAIDDFGRGYSNIETYTKLPITYLKLDKYFANDINNPVTANMVKHMVRMCQDCGKHLIVEGVESVRQKDRLLELGVRNMQGFLFGYPESREKFIEQAR